MSIQGWAASNATCDHIRKKVINLRKKYLKELIDGNDKYLLVEVLDEVLEIIENNRDE